MFAQIANGLKANLDGQLVDSLLAAYSEAKEKFYLGGLRLSEVEGGRFCEAAFRVIEHAMTGTFTPLGREIKSEKIIIAAENDTNLPDSLRILIPRTLRTIYGIRNKRNAAHLGDGIDPNTQDATFVVAALDWVLAELIRLNHSVKPDEAQRIIEDMVQRRAPAVQNFSGFLKILKPKLEVSDRVLLLLYERGAQRARYQELYDWVHPKMRKNLRRTLAKLEHDRALIHSSGDIFQITNAGMIEVEAKRLHEVGS